MRNRPGYRNLFAEIPTPAWDALVKEAEKQQDSVAGVVTKLLFEHFRIPLAKLPPRRKVGRKARVTT